MTKEAFDKQVIDMQCTLYHIACTLLASPHDREDAVQECIRKALQKYATLREDRYFSTWLVRILINECYALLRRKKRELPMEMLPEEVPEGAKPEVYALLSALEEKYRLPIVLHHIEGYTTREIAGILRVPEGTIKGRLVKARTQLRGLLSEEEVWA